MRAQIDHGGQKFQRHGPIQTFRGKRYERSAVNETRLDVIVVDELAENGLLFLKKTEKRDELGVQKVYGFSLEEIAGTASA